LCDRGVVERDEYERCNDAFFAHYKAGTLDINAFLEFVLAPLAAMPRPQLDALHAEFLRDRIEPMMTAQGKLLVRKHIEAGNLCAIVTATNAFVTAPIARLFGVQHLIATVPAQENGVFTGKPRGTPAFREGKVAGVESWLESMALNWQSFEYSYFYSDSLNDLPLLLKVNHPVAVDPDDTLRDHARKLGWPIISLRNA
ncbi:MAG TPA: HAD-IB family hydrolase, partial [Rhodocyclaceae bacterium]|nr:HAD-IB family hydrolase [Rhodocyclaceae bacterium]